MKKSDNFIKKFFLSYRAIPNKKPYVEFMTALLSIPVLLTVVLLNLNTLRDKDTKSENKSQEKVFITLPGGGTTDYAIHIFSIGRSFNTSFGTNLEN